MIGPKEDVTTLVLPGSFRGLRPVFREPHFCREALRSLNHCPGGEGDGSIFKNNNNMAKLKLLQSRHHLLILSRARAFFLRPTRLDHYLVH